MNIGVECLMHKNEFKHSTLASFALHYLFNIKFLIFFVLYLVFNIKYLKYNINYLFTNIECLMFNF